jgi:hypothetical protein
MSPRHRRRLTALGIAAALVLPGCGHAAMTMDHAQAAHERPQPPLTTTQNNWNPVADALGRTGTLMGGTV